MLRTDTQMQPVTPPVSTGWLRPVLRSGQIHAFFSTLTASVQGLIPVSTGIVSVISFSVIIILSAILIPIELVVISLIIIN